MGYIEVCGGAAESTCRGCWLCTDGAHKQKDRGLWIN